MKEEDQKPFVDCLQVMLPRRRGGITAEMMAQIAALKQRGVAVMHFAKDDPPSPILGAAMPPIGDPEMDRVDAFREVNLDCLGATLPLIVVNRSSFGKTMIPLSMAMEIAPKHFVPSYEAYHAQLHKYTEERVVKMPQTREKKPKHNPKPSRMAFLDGLGPNKKY